MSVSRSLTFLWTPWSVAASVARRARHGRALLRRLAAERLPAAGSDCSSCSGSRSSRCGAVLLNQPEWVEEFRPEEKPAIAVLWDASPSMETRDVVARRPADGRGDDPPRGDRAGRSSPSSWSRLRERMNVVIQPFSRREGRARHRPERAARQGAREGREPARDRAGLRRRLERGPAAGAGRRPKLRIKGVPVFAVPVGSRTRLPDVELLSLDVPTFGVAGKSVRIPFTIDSSLPREYVTTVTLQDVRRRRGHRRKSASPRWAGPATGSSGSRRRPATSPLTLDVPKHPDEIAGRQQHADARRSRSARRSSGSWSSSRTRAGSTATCAMPCRATRASSSRACSSIPGLSKPGGGNKDYIKQFPGRARRAVEVRRRLPGRRRRRRRPADGRAMPAAQGAGRASGERAGLHAGLAGPAVLAAGHRARRPLPGRAGPVAAGRLGLADARATSS